jgi:hypothetical protein
VVPHPYAPLFGTYGIASDVKIWACDVPSADRKKKPETQGGRAFLPRSCMMNKMIETETEYQGRDIDVEKKVQRSEYCDMDRLHTYLKIQSVSY